MQASILAIRKKTDLFRVFCMSYVGDSPQGECQADYCRMDVPSDQQKIADSSWGKERENGQRFSRVAKPSWVQTVGGTPLHNRCSIATDCVTLRSPTNIIWGLDVQSGHRNALSQHLREERCHQKKWSIEKMWIPRLVGGVMRFIPGK